MGAKGYPSAPPLLTPLVIALIKNCHCQHALYVVSSYFMPVEICSAACKAFWGLTWHNVANDAGWHDLDVACGSYPCCHIASFLVMEALGPATDHTVGHEGKEFSNCCSNQYLLPGIALLQLMYSSLFIIS